MAPSQETSSHLIPRKRIQALHRAEGALFHRYRLTASRLSVPAGDGRRARVLTWGSGPPLVMLHGLGIVSSHWAPLGARLRGRRCVAIDLPGIGVSDPVDFEGSDLREATVGFLATVFAEMGIESAPVLGSSYGGMCALWLAAEKPELVPAVAFLGAPGVVLPATGAPPTALLARLPAPAWTPKVLRPPHRSLTWLVLRAVLGADASRQLPPEAVDVTHAVLQVGRVRKEMWKLVRLLARPGPPGETGIVMAEEELRSVAAPCLFLWGKKDVYLRPAKAHRAVAQIPAARLEVVEGGHAPWFDDAEGCARSITSFLASLDVGTRDR